MEEEEEIHLSPMGKIIVAFIIGVLIGVSGIFYYNSHQVYRTPDEIATYLEAMLFNQSHFEDLRVAQLKSLISLDTTTVGELKRWYLLYNTSGLSHNLLTSQMSVICFKTRWGVQNETNFHP